MGFARRAETQGLSTCLHGAIPIKDFAVSRALLTHFPLRVLLSPQAPRRTRVPLMGFSLPSGRNHPVCTNTVFTSSNLRMMDDSSALDSLVPHTPAPSEDAAPSPLSWRCFPDPKIGAVAAAQSASLQRIYLWRTRWLSAIDPLGNSSPFARFHILRRRRKTNAFGIGIQLFKDPGIVVAVAGTSFQIGRAHV